MSEKIPVQVSNVSFTELFAQTRRPPDRRFSLAVDTYQRGFVWNDEKLRQLTSDLLEYQTAKKLDSPTLAKADYYMGTILIHTDEDKEEPRHFIIDGQQRLTALCVLYHQLHGGELPVNCRLAYSEKSARTIRRAAEIYAKSAGNLKKEIFGKIQFTVIQVKRVDLAFTFFDTQNNRGVSLHATDLLKAYHLRAVTGDAAQKENIQRLCGQRWERIQHGKGVLSHDLEFAPSLFTKFLWRSRNWTGSQVAYGDHDALMEEFQHGTWKTEGESNTIPLYRSRNNRLGTALTVEKEGYSQIHTNRISLSSHAVDLPFAIRQPVNKGIGFFLYAEKYAAMLQWLMQEKTASAELLELRRIYSGLMMENSLYLREVFLLCSLMFADQFGEERLGEFGRWLEHVLGSIRLDKQQVRYEAAQNFFKHDSRNLLDVISNSYRPEQVIRHLASHRQEEVERHYRNEQLEAGEGVQGRYKRAVLAYYGRTDGESLADKRSWIAKTNGGAKP